MLRRLLSLAFRLAAGGSIEGVAVVSNARLASTRTPMSTYSETLYVDLARLRLPHSELFL